MFPWLTEGGAVGKAVGNVDEPAVADVAAVVGLAGMPVWVVVAIEVAGEAVAEEMYLTVSLGLYAGMRKCLDKKIAGEDGVL